MIVYINKVCDRIRESEKSKYDSEEDTKEAKIKTTELNKGEKPFKLKVGGC